MSSDVAVRQAASSSLSLISVRKPYLVLSEWQTMFSKERKKSVKVTPNNRRRMSSAVTTNLSPTAEQCSLLI